MNPHACRAERIHHKTLERLRGEFVTYRDEDTVIERVKAVRGGSAATPTSGEGGFYVDADEDDWLILAERLVDADGAPIEPRPGATITPESAEAVFEVTNGAGGKCFTWSTANRVRMRIHTDRIERTDV